MDMIPLKPERMTQMEEYAQRRGQDTATALDDALATYLERPAAELIAELRQKHDNRLGSWTR